MPNTTNTIQTPEQDTLPPELALVHVIYASRSTHPFSEDELVQLLEDARTRNEKIGVTGMLLHCDGSFFQVLEGELGKLEKLYQKISRDKRHDEIVKIVQEPIEERAFGDWSMGYARASKDEIGALDGLNDFFVGKTCLHDVDLGRAKKLLGAFSEGKWRQ